MLDSSVAVITLLTQAPALVPPKPSTSSLTVVVGPVTVRLLSRFLENTSPLTVLPPGITLPGMLDIEYNPNGATCYGLSQSAMVSWIKDFVNTYHSKTTRYPLIYTTADWWNTCTGGSTAFSTTCPLVLARYASSPGTIPGDWGYQTIWQNADSYTYGGDSDIFNGDISRLKVLARGS